jgi:nucleoid DNA-binding protein
MDIGFYIADLLKKQDKVSLPGLGTFIRHKVPGSYNQISNSFLPPSFEVSFSNEILEWDSLSEYIRVKKNLSPSSAEYFVKKFTSGIFDTLQTSEIAEINHLGVIRKKNEFLTFEASANLAIAGKFFGLSPVTELKPFVEPEIQQVAAAAERRGDSIEDFITGQGAEQEIGVEEHFESERKGNRTLLIILGAFISAIIAGALLYMFNPTVKNLVERTLQEYKASTPLPDSRNVPATSPLAKPDSLNKGPSVIVQDSSMSDPVAVIEPIEQEPEILAEITKIEIIGATFGKRSEAEAYVITMKKRGLQAKIADDMPGKLFKVSLGSFSDDQSAQKELNRIVQEVEKTAWIAKYKSKKTQ